MSAAAVPRYRGRGPGYRGADQRQPGPEHLTARAGVLASTVWEILVRNGLNHLSWIDQLSGRVICHHERPYPGDLVYPDVK